MQKTVQLLRKYKKNILVGLLLIGCLGSFLFISAYQTFLSLGKETNTLGSFFSTPLTQNNQDQQNLFPLPTIDIVGLPPPIEWDGANRVTMLIMGLDYRDWEARNSASRSDTMILLTLDPVTKTAGILSIPRDLWANIPGFNPGKINTAHYLGELYKVPGGGPALAMQTVEAIIGVNIDYYARIDFIAFEKFIDHIGGVKINIPTAIKVYPIGRPSKILQSGSQVLPGYLALAYARVRNADGGDFSRSDRQQQVIMAIRNRLIDPRTFSIIVNNAPAIYADLSTGISTNLPFSDALELAFVAVKVEQHNIKRGAIDERYITFGTSPDELAILIPIPDKIRELRDEIFASSNVLSPFTTGSTKNNMNSEFASISVKNGTSDSQFGIKVSSLLSSNGANIFNLSSAAQTYQTSVIDHKGRPFTVKYLVELFDIHPSKIRFDYNPNSPVDIELIIGTDQINNPQIP